MLLATIIIQFFFLGRKICMYINYCTECRDHVAFYTNSRESATKSVIGEQKICIRLRRILAVLFENCRITCSCIFMREISRRRNADFNSDKFPNVFFCLRLINISVIVGQYF